MSYNVQRLPAPSVVVKKQLTTLQAVGQANYTAGVQTPKKDPIAAGVAAEPKWANAMQTAIASGIRAQNLAQVSPTDWSNAAVTIGAPALVPGVMARQAKVNTFWNGWMPVLGNILNTIDAMPNATATDRNNKATAMANALRAAKGTW